MNVLDRFRFRCLYRPFFETGLAAKKMPVPSFDDVFIASEESEILGIFG